LSKQASAAQVGVICAIAAYSMWGVAPVYFKQLMVLPAAEILMHRGNLVCGAFGLGL
jgi:Predicted permeases